MSDDFPIELELLCQLADDDTPLDELTPAQNALLSSPQSLLFALSFGLCLPKALEKKWGPRFLQYVEFMANETRIYLRGHDDPDLLTALAEACAIEPEAPELNIEFAYQLFAILRANRFALPPESLAELERRQGEQHSEAENPFGDPNDPQAGIADFLDEMITRERIESAPHFVAVAADQLAMLPAPGLEVLLGHLAPYPWAVEALLILTLHHEAAVARAAASALDTLPANKWKQLANSQYLVLVRRFGCQDAQKHLAKWQKMAMKHVKASPPGRIDALYASFIDGNQAMLFSGTLQQGRQRHQFGGVFRLGIGLVDGYYHPELPPEQYEQLTQRLQEEMHAVRCDPLLLKHLLPWALQTQLTGPEPLGLDLLPMLAQLPQSWLEPQPISLERIRTVCQIPAISATDLEHYRKGSERLLHTPHTLDWTISEIAPGLGNAKQVRDHHYLAQPQPYIDSLGLNALVAHFSQETGFHRHPLPRDFLGAAYVLQQGEIGRKTFPLFDHLAALSLERQQGQIWNSELKDRLADPKGYVIKVELIGSRPKIWRRITLSGAMGMGSFHHLLQRAMGWENAHLFMFNTPMGMLDDETPLDEIPLMAVLPEPGATIEYLYDFGDQWQHVITLEKILTRDSRVPKVTAGRGACPPEDCGGIWGYRDLLALRRKATLDEEEAEQLEWYGIDADFDPSAFDKYAIEL